MKLYKCMYFIARHLGQKLTRFAIAFGTSAHTQLQDCRNQRDRGANAPPPEFGWRKSLTCSIKWPYLSSFPYFDWNRSKTCPIRWPSFPSHIFRLSYGPELHWQKSDEAQQDVLFPHIWSITILLLDIISWKSLFPQSFVYFMIPLLDIKTGRFLVFKHMSAFIIFWLFWRFWLWKLTYYSMVDCTAIKWEENILPTFFSGVITLQNRLNMSEFRHSILSPKKSPRRRSDRLAVFTLHGPHKA